MIAPLLPTYNRAPLAFERGDGVWIYTADGTPFLDFGAGVAVSILGHAHPHLVAALTDQARKLWHTSNLYQIPHQEKLARRLVERTFADTVFFCNSGAEALECAIKVARRHHWSNGRGNRNRIVTFEGAFHGRTLATIAAGGQAKYLEGFGPVVEGFDQVPFDDDAALEAAVSDRTAAILIEPVQGEGGIRPVPHARLRMLRELCDERGVLLIFDEVQCGMGRTGRFFAHEWAGITPDIMAIAKGIGGGFPMGACLSTERVGSAMGFGAHGSTFGGNPLAMAVGNAVLDVVLADGFFDQVRARGIVLMEKLGRLKDRYPAVVETVRGAGLMVGVKCRVPNVDVISACHAERLLAIAAGDNVVRLLPPLIVTDAEIGEAVERLERACAAVAASLPARATA
ncbi:MAG TPA: aspartate aminotransferase family protein [Aestuariivirgaceae bacterium]|nr:aspartate aminotransferase family protein [Aestuariivirgaceae bacterium]